MLRRGGRRARKRSTRAIASIDFTAPSISTTPATSTPNTAAAGSALALVVTDGTDGTFVGSRWYAWNESTQSLGALLGTAGSIAADTAGVTRPNFFFGNSGKTLDLVVILPQDSRGINPQKSKGLDADGGLIIQNWRNVVILGGEFDFRTDYVQRDGGIGFNLLATSTTTVRNDGAGSHDERMRAIRARDYSGTFHIEGVKFGGVALYEAIDVSHGGSASSVFQVQRCQFGDSTNHIKNLRAAFNFYTTNDGAVRQAWYPTFDHSGGDCIQCWTGPIGIIRAIHNTFYTDFQALFFAWDDQSGSTLRPERIVCKRNEIHSYVSGPWLYYDTKSGTLAPPPADFEDNFIILHGYTKSFGTLIKSGSYTVNSGTVVGNTYDGRSFADFVGTTFPAGSEHTGAQAFRSGSPVNLIAADGTFTGGRVGANYSPSLWTADPTVVAPTPTIAGFALTMDDQFLSPTISSDWNVRTDAFGSSAGQAQQWQASNVAGGQPLAGATGGAGLMLIPRKPASPVNGFTYTAGMLDSQSAGRLHPLYGRYKIRLQTPHYQGLWPAFWLTAPGAAGGATRIEIDLFEYFFGQVPGKNSITIYGWGNTAGVSQAANPAIGLPTTGEKYTNNGNSGRAGRTLFEQTSNFSTPQWHTFEIEILPVTDATGTTVRDDLTTMASQYVRFRFWTDGVLLDTFVDNQAIAWTGSTQGGVTTDHFFNIYLQGCQMGGKFIGDVAGPLGYSTPYASANGGNGCFNGGTSPNACTVPAGAGRLADFTTAGADDRLALKVDYIQVYQAVSQAVTPPPTTIAGPAVFRAAPGGVSTGASGNATTLAVPLASTTAGDANVISVSLNSIGGAANSDPGNPVTPAGWTLIKESVDLGSPSNRLVVYGRLFQTGDASSVTLDFSPTTLPVNASAIPTAYSGVDQTNPFPAADAVATSQSASSATFTAPALTTGADGVEVSVFSNRTSGTWNTIPDTSRGQVSANSASNLAVCDTNTNVGAGAKTARAAVFSAATSVGNAISFLVKSAP